MPSEKANRKMKKEIFHFPTTIQLSVVIAELLRKKWFLWCLAAFPLSGMTAETPLIPPADSASANESPLIPAGILAPALQKAPPTEEEQGRRRMLEAIAAMKAENGNAAAPVVVEEEAVEVAPVVQATLLNPLPRARSGQALVRGETLVDGVGGIAGNLISAPLLQTPSAPQGFRFGKIAFRTGLEVGIATSHLLRPEPGVDLRETYGILTPTFSVGIGDESKKRFLQLSSVTGITYTTDRFRNVDEDLDLHGTYAFNRLRLDAGLSFSRLSGISRDIGSTITREILTATGTASYRYSAKTSMSLEISLPVRQFSGQATSKGVTITPSLDYKFSPRTTLGLEVAVGTLRVGGGETQTFQRPALRMEYGLNERLTLQGSLGVEHRESGEASTNTPVFELGASWLLRESTIFGLSAERRISNSAFESGVNYTSTSIQFTVSQRLGSRLRSGLSFGFEDAAYEGTFSSFEDERHDQLVTGRANLAFIVTPHVSITLTGAAIDNRSNQQPFRSYQGSLQSSIAF